MFQPLENPLPIVKNMQIFIVFLAIITVTCPVNVMNNEHVI